MEITKEQILDVMKNLNDEDMSYIIYNKINNFGETINGIAEDLDYDISYGCSKIVVDFDEDCDWVIKIPRLAAFKNNYCKIEKINYELAVENGLQDFFAETRFVDYFFDIPVYIQRKMKLNEDNISNKLYSFVESRLSKENEADFCSDYDKDCFIQCEIDEMSSLESLTAILSDEYCPEDIEKLANFCEDNDINDFHCGNFGYDENGHMRLIDFSGI